MKETVFINYEKDKIGTLVVPKGDNIIDRYIDHNICIPFDVIKLLKSAKAKFYCFQKDSQVIDTIKQYNIAEVVSLSWQPLSDTIVNWIHNNGIKYNPNHRLATAFADSLIRDLSKNTNQK